VIESACRQERVEKHSKMFAIYMEVIQLTGIVGHWLERVMASKTGEAELHDFTMKGI
jgi:hypothetical protein